jgi:hypothetical protein
MAWHDCFKIGASQNVAYAAAGGASAQSTAFGAQTRWIRVVAVGVVSATIDGVRIAVDTSPTATATSTLLPVNWVEVIQVTPGQKIAVLGNAATGTGSVNITELTN